MNGFLKSAKVQIIRNQISNLLSLLAYLFKAGEKRKDDHRNLVDDLKLFLFTDKS